MHQIKIATGNCVKVLQVQYYRLEIHLGGFLSARKQVKLNEVICHLPHTDQKWNHTRPRLRIIQRHINCDTAFSLTPAQRSIKTNPACQQTGDQIFPARRNRISCLVTGEATAENVSLVWQTLAVIILCIIAQIDVIQWPNSIPDLNNLL